MTTKFNHRENFLKDTGIELPIICGAMYPCSNPELIASVSKSGGIGIIQPLSMVYVHKHKFEDGMKLIRSITDKPIGMNVLVEKSTSIYKKRMDEWIDIALDYGVKFFVTALGNPREIVEKVKKKNGTVYHDVTELKWAQKAAQEGVDGFICVNNLAGGHAGKKSPEELFHELSILNKTLVCAGGVGDSQQLKKMLDLGYGAVQIGTRFIASRECRAHQDYKDAIVKAKISDIVLTEKISGIPVSVINTPYVEKTGTKAGWFARKMLRHPKLKHYMRLYYSLISFWMLKEASNKGGSYQDYWQAGKSVAGIDRVLSVDEIMSDLKKAL